MYSLSSHPSQHYQYNSNTIQSNNLAILPNNSNYCSFKISNQSMQQSFQIIIKSIINKKACLYLFLIIQATTINTINTIQMQCNSTKSRRIAKQYNYCFILQNIKSIINKKHVLPNKTKTNYQVNQCQQVQQYRKKSY